MRKILFILIILFISTQAVRADIDYMRIYQGLQPADFSYIHDIDPDQYYDMQSYAWSPYPLFRLTSEIYFKNKKIEPGYYLLTPREHDGKWYILFKENGVVKHYIPCYDRDVTPEVFYEQNLPKEKLTPSQKFHIGFIHTVSMFGNSAKRKKSPQTFLEVDDLDNDFINMTVYYGAHKYSILLRSKQLQ